MESQSPEVVKPTEFGDDSGLEMDRGQGDFCPGKLLILSCGR